MDTRVQSGEYNKKIHTRPEPTTLPPTKRNNPNTVEEIKMTRDEKHEFVLELVREGQIGANTYNVVYEYLYGDMSEDN